MVSTVLLIKALGGGWESRPPASAEVRESSDATRKSGRMEMN
jgi:hypothetical protein